MFRRVLFSFMCFSLCSISSFAQSKDYSDSSFRTGEILNIDVSIDNRDIKRIFDNPLNRTMYPAALTIHGEIINIGFGINGKTTLLDNTRLDIRKLPLKINFTSFKGNPYHGISEINLNNEYMDPSFMRESIAFDIFKEMGIPVPARSYADLSINGRQFGFYYAVEEIGRGFCERYYNSTLGERYKPEGKGANLEWLGFDETAYKAMGPKTKAARQYRNLLKMVRAANFAATPRELEAVLNVDQWLRYLAVCAALVNYDSFLAENSQNYFLYEKDGRFDILPYDLGMSFGALPMKNYTDIPVSELYIDDPTDGFTGSKPLILKLFSFPEYVDKYHEYIKIVAENFLEESRFEQTVDNLAELIRPYVQADTNSLYGEKSFDEDVIQLKEFAQARRISILDQLNGTAPSVGPNGPTDAQLSLEANSAARNDIRNQEAIRANKTALFIIVIALAVIFFFLVIKKRK